MEVLGKSLFISWRITILKRIFGKRATLLIYIPYIFWKIHRCFRSPMARSSGWTGSWSLTALRAIIWRIIRRWAVIIIQRTVWISVNQFFRLAFLSARAGFWAAWVTASTGSSYVGWGTGLGFCRWTRNEILLFFWSIWVLLGDKLKKRL